MVIRVDPASATAPYEQIRRQLAEEIAAGRLPAGARLPTVRGLADELGVAVNTVARAYRELEAAGLIETRGRNGSVVTAGGDATRERVRAAAADYVALVRSLGLTHADAVRQLDAAWDA